MHSTIRFLKSTSRYRKAVGDTDSLMGYGIHESLVRRGIAEWVLNPSGISEPVATDTPKRRKRSETIEE